LRQAQTYGYALFFMTPADAHLKKKRRRGRSGIVVRIPASVRM
jgi:hypothetical protein